VRVPWIVRWPGQVAAGARLAAPVSHVDVAPTLLGLAGVPAPADWEGRDLSAWLRGQGGPPPPDRPLFSDAVYLAEDDPAHPHELAVVVAPYKLITRVHPRANGGVEVRPHALYDLVADPGETQDLLGDPARAAVVDGLLAQARDLLARGRVLPEQGSLAADMDPLMRRWMAEMGYLK
jgi:arylsulfatase A-like enzyme